MKIRPATNADAAAVRDVVFEVLHEYGLAPDTTGTDADLEDIEGTYLGPGGTFDVLEDEEGRLLGTVGLSWLHEGVCELRKMYLRKNARGRGLGRRLLDHALARARELGFRRVELETASKLVEAIAMYRRYGFTPIAREHMPRRCDQAYALDL